jgi:hypothetical protein
VVIVELQNNLRNLNLEAVPGLITVEQYRFLAREWRNAFSDREGEKVYTINLYQEADINPSEDLLDGAIHLNHNAMVRAADALLELIRETQP